MAKFSKGERDQVSSGGSVDAGPFQRRGRMPGPADAGEVADVIFGGKQAQPLGWKPPSLPQPINASTGPPAPAMYSKIGNARPRRQPDEHEIEQRRYQAEESAKAFHDAHNLGRDVRGRANPAASPLAPAAGPGPPVDEQAGLAGNVGAPQPGVLRERNCSRPSSRELEAVKADAGMSGLFRDIEVAAAEARHNVDVAAAGESYWDAKAVAQQTRNRNRSAGSNILGHESASNVPLNMESTLYAAPITSIAGACDGAMGAPVNLMPAAGSKGGYAVGNQKAASLDIFAAPDPLPKPPVRAARADAGGIFAPPDPLPEPPARDAQADGGGIFASPDPLPKPPARDARDNIISWG
eukprot:TRINITY_DN27575_c0_g1_i1.p1 TRINITY_DN27575_c0_g1~~TRINITY_DN27575_c0_g1_i1.p1  ORF type:complete len:375 (+),score=89.69 TRINITY_DN27575_c0_g1_i1:68-1126(+)